jgi:GT2 family glycosyltransferase
VEPGLEPRLHRFAQPPVLLDRQLRPLPLAVCVDLESGGDPAATRASLERQTVAPEAVAEGRGPGTLDALRADWLVIVPAGDRLAPAALERLGAAVAAADGATLITCDEDEVGRRGQRTRPACRPGPSPELLLARDHLGAVLMMARDRALAVRPQPGGAWRYELGLRLAGPAGAGHAHLPSILVHRAPGPRRTADELEVAAAARVLAERGEPAARVEPAGPGRRRVRRPAQSEPSVEAIVCFRDRPELLRRCTSSLLERSGYERLTLRLVDNGSSDPAVAELLARLERDPRVTAERDPRPFHFAALNNAAAARSPADALVFVNNDVEALTPSWVAELLEEAQREEVGAVAPLLLYDNGRVQHVGAALGLHGYAGHPFAGLVPDAPTPLGSAVDGTRNWLAVSAACLMVERRKFAAVGGFDEGFAVGGNDVDLCLRLTAAGHRSLCLPHVRMRHHESASRDPLAIPAGDLARSRERYGAFRTVGDPFYNPNLTLVDTDCSLRAPDEPEPR